MEAKAQWFAQIVSEPKYIVVPLSQRGYVWEKENWEDLLDELSKSESNHFLGSVIFKHSHNNMGENFWSVVDCQQKQVINVVTGNANDAFDEKGHRRFYSNIILRYGDKQYLLTSQWRENGKPPRLGWFTEHGIIEERVAELCG